MSRMVRQDDGRDRPDGEAEALQREHYGAAADAAARHMAVHRDDRAGGPSHDQITLRSNSGLFAAMRA
jgi:hypothetical protein